MGRKLVKEELAVLAGAHRHECVCDGQAERRRAAALPPMPRADRQIGKTPALVMQRGDSRLGQAFRE
jgi:hypothetical protein